MGFFKMIKDQLIKAILGKSAVPRGLFELGQYFRHHGPITFKYEQGEDGRIIAISENFRFGSIVTSGKDKEELDKNIKDAILTSFDIPSSFKDEAGIYKIGDAQEKYALA